MKAHALLSPSVDVTLSETKLRECLGARDDPPAGAAQAALGGRGCPVGRIPTSRRTEGRKTTHGVESQSTVPAGLLDVSSGRTLKDLKNYPGTLNRVFLEQDNLASFWVPEELWLGE